MGGFKHQLKYVPLKLYCSWQGVTILLMGSKEEDVPAEPAEKPLFVEDMNESELASAVSTLQVASTAKVTERMNMVVELFLCSYSAYWLFNVYYYNSNVCKNN